MKALGMLACNDGFRVRFYSAPALANELASPRCSRPITLRFTKHTGKQLFLDHLEISRWPFFGQFYAWRTLLRWRSREKSKKISFC